MAKIIELDANLADKIAAGEVVERPASVVKELVENAIDAGSSQITVAVEESGLKSISVTDNGEGISADDVKLALKRHATSKIKTADDLFRIRTLGFRGEAMPSIASVSEMTIETSVGTEEAGSYLYSKGGNIETFKPAAKRAGTKITVENLFFNTPARLKYMKSMQAELSHITDVINRQSLAHPEISFTLINDGKQMMKTAGNGDLKTAIAGVYGVSTAKKMVEISASDLDFDLKGYVSLPELTRANRNYITVLINGRYIKNFLINRAIVDGYGSKLMVGRFPVSVLDIRLDPFLADVNVHPTKQEVRLSKEKELMDLVKKVISEALQPEVLIPDALDNLQKSREKRIKPEQTTLPLTSSNLYYDKERHDFFVKDDVKEELPKSFTSNRQERTPFEKEKDFSSAQTQEVSLVEEELEIKEDVSSPAIKFATRIDESEDDVEHPDFNFSDKKSLKEFGTISDKLVNEEESTFPELDYFGQMHGTYLFAQGRDGLYIVDQHAAQERIKYEYFRDKIGEVEDKQQQLLVPYIFTFPTDDFLLIKEKLDILAQTGINLQEYGDRQFILREHPTWLNESEVEAAVYQMIDMLLTLGRVSVKEYRADLAIMMSCKKSIKANHWLDELSARKLIVDLAKCKNPYNCPHGRPVLVHFTKSDMEKMFRRIQENHRGGWNLEF
ncbi:DNA mismatch repair endonuclease MutL [Floricoccus penangensis]|uniref:DNA mismatch repair endonuclease MutL n=1 Tax=Floricoccus penangensis TaxID=1859475 RepID=UPI00203DDF90|nr:DNA mismatch repair endonuclease MutL [Floricoccus penangensis]URZ87333.1 DNA mismatch repair endonuclease MutL [Floricoccus penangensis]